MDSEEKLGNRNGVHRAGQAAPPWNRWCRRFALRSSGTSAAGGAVPPRGSDGGRVAVRATVAQIDGFHTWLAATRWICSTFAATPPTRRSTYLGRSCTSRRRSNVETQWGYAISHKGIAGGV